MTTPVDERGRADREEDSRTAFGLALQIDPRIAIPGLGRSAGSVLADAPSRIRLDDGEMERRWGALTTAPVRARELRLGEMLLLSVDFAEPAGYLLWARDFAR